MTTLNEDVQTPEVENVLETPASEENPAPAVEDNVNEDFTKTQDTNDQQVSAENQDNVEEFSKNEEKPKDEGDKDQEKNNEDNEEEDEDKKKPTKNELEEKYSLLEAEFNELKEKYTSLESQNAKLLEFKNAAEDKEKDALIAQFYMLSDDDKKEVIENKSKYSLEDIEAKLSVICVRKKVNFEKDSDAEQKTAPTAIFNLNSGEAEDSLPAWLKAVESHTNRNN